MGTLSLKPEIATRLLADDNGYLHISQGGKDIRLSYAQVDKLLVFLQKGNGMRLEAGWNHGLTEGE